MTRFLKWRKMTWALLLWGALIGLWMVSGTFALALLAGVLGFIVLVAMWFLASGPRRAASPDAFSRGPIQARQGCRLLAQLEARPLAALRGAS